MRLALAYSSGVRRDCSSSLTCASRDRGRRLRGAPGLGNIPSATGPKPPKRASVWRSSALAGRCSCSICLRVWMAARMSRALPFWPLARGDASMVVSCVSIARCPAGRRRSRPVAERARSRPNTVSGAGGALTARAPLASSPESAETGEENSDVWRGGTDGARQAAEEGVGRPSPWPCDRRSARRRRTKRPGVPSLPELEVASGTGAGARRPSCRVVLSRG